MNKVAYSAIVAFISSILTLLIVVWVMPTSAENETSIREISLAELGEHDSADRCWKAINGRVYDVTDFIDRHPTPPSVMTDWCGREATEGWEGIGDGTGHSSFAETLLDDYLIGYLQGANVDPEADRQAAVATGSSSSGGQSAQSNGNDGGLYRDGSYYAEAEPGERGTFGVVEITVHDGRIAAVYYDEFKRDENGMINYRKSEDVGYAERWRGMSGGVTQLSAYPAYEKMLVERGQPDQVDAISGATSAHRAFVDLSETALSEARLP